MGDGLSAISSHNLHIKAADFSFLHRNYTFCGLAIYLYFVSALDRFIPLGIRTEDLKFLWLKTNLHKSITTQESATRVALGLAFCAFAFLGNYHNFGVVAGTYHFFGSIGVWAALATLGPKWGLTAALIGAAPAATSLGCWPVALIFLLEALFVVALTSRVRMLASRINFHD